MNTAEATAALARLHGHWPLPAFDEAQAFAWRARMDGWSREEFDLVVDRLVDTGRRDRPVVAEVAREIAQVRFHARLRDMPALPAPELPSPEERAAWLARCREALR